MLARNGHRVVSISFDELRGRALYVDVCNHPNRSRDRYAVRLLAQYSNQSLGDLRKKIAPPERGQLPV